MSEPASQQASSAWMHCSACRKDIPFQAVYWVCSVSTCNRERTRLVFCSVACWDSHLSTVRHRESWAVEERAPTRAAWLAQRGESGASPTHRSEAPTAPLRPATFAPAPRAPVAMSAPASSMHAPSSSAAPARVVVGSTPPPSSSAPAPARQTVTSGAFPPSVVVLSSAFERDMLIVVSKLKKYVKDRSGMNTSDAVAEALGDHVRAICDQAIQAAAADGRKTVLERDVPPAPRR